MSRTALGKGVISTVAFALLTLPALAGATPWLIMESEYDSTQTAALMPSPAQRAGGSLIPRAGLSAGQALSTGASSNLAVAIGSAQQDEPSSIPDGLGGAIIVWDDNRRDPDGEIFDIYAEHVLACGTLDPTWPAGGVLIYGGGGNRHAPVPTTDGSGGALIAWSDFLPGGNGDIYAQHLLSGGAIDPSWPVNGAAVCTAPGSQGIAKVASDGAHGAFVTWEDPRLGNVQRRVFVQHLLGSGVDPSWPVNGLRATPTISADQSVPEICSDGLGGCIVTWVDRRTAAISNRDIYAQRISASGSLLWSSIGVPVCTVPGQQILFGLLDPTFTAVYATTWTDIQSNAIVPDGANGCFITWTDGRTLASTSGDIYAQHLTASGNIASGWAVNGVAVCTTPDNQSGPTILSDGTGGAITTWVDSRQGVFAQHIAASGVVDGPSGGLALSTVGGGGVPVGVSDGSGGAIFAWEDSRVLGVTWMGFGPFGFDYAQHVRTVPTFSVDPGWMVNGVPMTAVQVSGQGGQDISTGGGLVSNGSGGAIVFWSDYRDADTNNQDVYAQDVLASGSFPVFSATGHVLANCPSPNTGLYGVTVDAYQVGTGDLVGSAVTDGSGSYAIPNLCWGSGYTLTDVTPLDYSNLANDLPANGCSSPVDFALQCRPATGTVQSMGFWKHEVGVATGGNGHGQLSPTTLCSYLDLIAVHFNDNAINPVIVYQPPASGQCADKLQVARVHLDLQGNAAMIARARQQLMSLLLNVAAGDISQTKVISADGATVSQAITYCDNVIDSPTGNYERAKSIADDVNNGVTVPAGWIPLTTAQIAYRRGMEGVSFRMLPDASGGTREFQFMTGARGPVSLRLFDVSGRLVAELYRGTMEAGPHSVSWDGRAASGAAIARGLYFARLQTQRESPTIKVALTTAN